MKQIVKTRKGPAVETSGSAWATVAAVILVVPTVFAGYAAWFYDGSVVALAASVALIAAAVLLLARGRRKRTLVKAVLSVARVPGGALVTVMDVKGARHELVMSEAAAEGLTVVVAERSGQIPVA